MDSITLYSTPIWKSEYPNFGEKKEDFLKILTDFRNKNQTIEPAKSNVFGYQSPPTLHFVEELRLIFEYVCQMGFKAVDDLDFVDCDIFLTSAWLNVNDSRQCMNNEHVHSDTFSGVFYLKAPEGSGKLVIQNPSMNRMWQGTTLVEQKNEVTAQSVKIEPEEGTIILFPSYLSHSVETNDHDDERISISFNIIALPKGQMKF